MPQSPSKLSRRTLFAGAGTAGALATAAALLPGAREAATDLVKAPKEPPARGGGYELSEHVQRYYRTTRV
ncbi:formate dehydrogenase [Ramlibacter algicola]|uniref:Formate dehydrogenase n=1 Tax=Ramlibacter algicola TaxID=2795217 RepID=A0A934Q1V1_9BURK|nr:formate dehydrogenase [Ramlibacter algicola]